MNCGGGEAMHIGEQVRFGVMCEVVGLGDVEGRIGGDVDFCRGCGRHIRDYDEAKK